MRKVLILVFVTTLLSCNSNKKSEYPNPKDAKTTSVTHPGKKLMETKCNVCHSPSALESSRIAPPMAAIKWRYIDNKTSKEKFSNDIWAFLEQPTKENAKMRGAVERFGVMPYQPFLEEEIRSISEYIFDNQIEEPEWFKEHMAKVGNNGIYRHRGKRIDTIKKDPKSHEDIGLEYALNTKKLLGKNLMSAIQEKGTLAALGFCNTKAQALTDSMAMVHNAGIKRVSDKARNMKNQANQLELAYINTFKKQLSSGKEIKPIVKYENERVNFYYPITTNTMCIQCHGKPNENIKPDIITALTQLYPNDKAINYGVNEVRGIWSISFKE